MRRTHVTLKLSSGSGGVWFLMYSAHTTSVTLPLLATAQYLVGYPVTHTK